MTTVSSSTNAIGRQATLTVQQKGELVSIALSGTYNMEIQLEREVGAPGSGAWEEVGTAYKWSTEDATVAATYVTREHNERLALNVTVDSGGTVVYSYSDGDFTLATIEDDYGNLKQTRK